MISLKLCDRTTSPQWNESFHFLVHNPKHQMLVVKVRFFLLFKPLKDLLGTCQSSKSRVNSSFCRSLPCSCSVVGTSQWDLWWLRSKGCLQSHSWSWTSGSIWMEPRLRVRSCSGLNSRWELTLIDTSSGAAAVSDTCSCSVFVLNRF